MRTQHVLVALPIVALCLIGRSESVPRADEAPVPPEVLAKRHEASKENLKELALAMHKFHNAWGQLPLHAIYTRDGTPTLSWRVALLPYLGEEKLYGQFKLSEPWDGPTNKELLAKMPKVFAVDGVKSKVPHGTYYQVFTCDRKAEVHTFFSRDPTANLTLSDVTNADGTSNTIMIVEAADPVPWTKPDDLDFDAKKLPPLGCFPDRVHVVFGDRAVRVMKKKADETLLRQLLGFDDGGTMNTSDAFFNIK